METQARLKVWVASVWVAGLVSGVATGVALPEAFRMISPSATVDPVVLELQRRYNLTTEQILLIDLVLRDRRERKARIVEEESELRPEFEAKLREIYRRAEDRIEAVLDSEQRAQYRKDAPDAGPPAREPK